MVPQFSLITHITKEIHDGLCTLGCQSRCGLMVCCLLLLLLASSQCTPTSAAQWIVGTIGSGCFQVDTADRLMRCSAKVCDCFLPRQAHVLRTKQALLAMSLLLTCQYKNADIPTMMLMFYFTKKFYSWGVTVCPPCASPNRRSRHSVHLVHSQVITLVEHIPGVTHV